ncbi:hypothetical protein [Staphylococcus phage PT94]
MYHPTKKERKSGMTYIFRVCIKNQKMTPAEARR